MPIQKNWGGQGNYVTFQGTGGWPRRPEMQIRVRGALAAASLVSLFALAGCESPAPYAPLAGHATGYTDERLGANRWRVTFIGNSVTSRRTVEDYLLLRAA